MSFESCFGGFAGSKSAPAAMGGFRPFVATALNGEVAPIADLHSTRAWGMPLDYRLSYASLPEAG